MLVYTTRYCSRPIGFGVVETSCQTLLFIHHCSIYKSRSDTLGTNWYCLCASWFPRALLISLCCQEPNKTEPWRKHPDLSPLFSVALGMNIVSNQTPICLTRYERQQPCFFLKHSRKYVSTLIIPLKYEIKYLSAILVQHMASSSKMGNSKELTEERKSHTF